MPLVCYHCHTPLADEQAQACPTCQSLQCLTRGSKVYRIKGVLGQGGFGQVFDAIEGPTLQRPCAIKRINEDPPRLSRQMIEKEVAVLSTQGHRLGFIPDVYDYWDDGLSHYIVMQFIEGETLDKVHTPPWPIDRVISFLKDLLQRLIHLHRVKIIHRDIKPRNIKYNPQRGYVLLDFGLASQRGSSTAQGYTPGFAPPEQFDDGRSIRRTPDERSDLYSLAATAYYLLTNGPPPYNPDPRRSPRAAVLSFPGFVPPDLEALLRQMLAIDPDERPANAAATLKALDQISVQLSGQPTLPDVAIDPDAPTAPDGTSDWDVLPEIRTPSSLLYTTAPQEHYAPIDVMQRRGRINDLALSASGELTIASALGVARYHIAERREVSYTPLSQAPQQVAYGQGQVLLVADAAGLQVDQPERGALRKHPRWFGPHTAGQMSVAPRSNLLAEISEREVVICAIDEPLRHVDAIQIDGIQTAALAPDGRRLAIAVGARVLVYELAEASHQLVRTLPAPGPLVHTVTFAAEGQLLAIGSATSVDIWQIEGGRRRATITMPHDAAQHLALSPDGRTLAVASARGVALYATAEPLPTPTLLEPGGPICRVAFDPHGQTLAACSREAAWVWQLDQRKLLLEVADRYLDSVNCLAFSPDSLTLATLGGQLRLWRFDSGTLRFSSTLGAHERGGNGLAFDPSGRVLAACSASWLRIWRADGTRDPMIDLAQGAAQAHGIAFADGGRQLLLLGHDAIQCYDLDQRRGETLTPSGSIHTSLFNDEYSVAFAPGGERLVAFNGHDIEVLERKGGTQIATIRAIEVVNDVAITADGQLIAAATEHGVQAWALDSSPPRPLKLTGDWANLVVFSPDGQRLVTINQATIHLYRVHANELIEEQRLVGHNGPVTDVVFRPSDGAIASAGSDGAVLLWTRG